MTIKYLHYIFIKPNNHSFISIKVLLVVLSSVLMIRPAALMLKTHYKCRGGIYPRSTIERFIIPDDKVRWSVDFQNYNPPNYTCSSIYGKPWADPDIGEANFEPKWNTIDGKVNRKSYMGQYGIVNGFPINPIGRTGIVGRGVLGRWGPNHAADPIVTRWKRLDTGEIVMSKSHNIPILQFVAIKRSDTGEWALPGGMVDPGEKVTLTAVREFQEEATNSLLMSTEKKEAWQKKFKSFFSGGELIYQGYIDDRRNTDNAWMESSAYNFHDDSGSTVGALNLNAGDDAVGVRWVDITPEIKLYASHSDIVLEVLNKRLGNKSS